MQYKLAFHQRSKKILKRPLLVLLPIFLCLYIKKVELYTVNINLPTQSRCFIQEVSVFSRTQVSSA